ncbi:MAG TPA: hypothetical protein VFN67_12970 [Polyangiales bacterium]|nr:hypothetical protein [Polyangiales bacterium]
MLHHLNACALFSLPLAAACSRATPTTEAPSTTEAPAPVAIQPEQPELAPLQRARLDYTFQAAALLQRDWPAMHPARTCVLLVEPELQWVINCDVAPSNFERTSQRFRDHAVFVHRGGSFESEGQARSTAQLLATTPAAAQVPTRNTRGLPGNTPWLVVGSLEALAQFHPAFPNATTEAWVSVVMHELVHTHQLRAPGAERFVDQIVSLQRTPSALTDLYLKNTRFHALIAREYALLTAAALTDPSDKQAARTALKRWLELYQRRRASLHDLPNAEQLVADDVLFSYIEGAARFVESQFLADPSLHPSAAALSEDPRFKDFALFRDRGYAGSPNRQLDEHYFYAIGYHLCVLLDRLDTSWRTRVHTRDRFLYDLVREVAVNAK